MIKPSYWFSVTSWKGNSWYKQLCFGLIDLGPKREMTPVSQAIIKSYIAFSQDSSRCSAACPKINTSLLPVVACCRYHGWEQDYLYSNNSWSENPVTILWVLTWIGNNLIYYISYCVLCIIHLETLPSSSRHKQHEVYIHHPPCITPPSCICNPLYMACSIHTMGKWYKDFLFYWHRVKIVYLAHVCWL